MCISVILFVVHYYWFYVCQHVHVCKFYCWWWYECTVHSRNWQATAAICLSHNNHNCLEAQPTNDNSKASLTHNNCAKQKCNASKLIKLSKNSSTVLAFFCTHATPRVSTILVFAVTTCTYMLVSWCTCTRTYLASRISMMSVWSLLHVRTCTC